MTFLFVHFLGDVVFILDVLAGLVNGVSDERLDLLGFAEANTLVEHELTHDVDADFASQLGVKHAESLMELLGSGRLVLLLHHDVQHVGFELGVPDEITGLFFFELDQDNIGDLSFTRVLEKEPHDVRDFLLVNVVIVLHVRVLPSFPDLMLVEIFLLSLFDRVHWSWQHI